MCGSVVHATCSWGTAVINLGCDFPVFIWKKNRTGHMPVNVSTQGSTSVTLECLCFWTECVSVQDAKYKHFNHLQTVSSA